MIFKKHIEKGNITLERKNIAYQVDLFVTIWNDKKLGMQMITMDTIDIEKKAILETSAFFPEEFDEIIEVYYELYPERKKK